MDSPGPSLPAPAPPEVLVPWISPRGMSAWWPVSGVDSDVLSRAGRTQLPSWLLTSPHPLLPAGARLHTPQAPQPPKVGFWGSPPPEHLPPAWEADSSPAAPRPDPAGLVLLPRRDGELLRWQRDGLGPREGSNLLLPTADVSRRREPLPPCGPGSHQGWSGPD